MSLESLRDWRIWTAGAVVVLVALAGVYMYLTQAKTALMPGQYDSHNCLAAEGYSWCGARNKCERASEHYCSEMPGKVVRFSCDAGQAITATFYPSDDVYVDLELSDGRLISVPHALSASGARYATEDESFVFWNKGDTSFITESGEETYSNCAVSG